MNLYEAKENITYLVKSTPSVGVLNSLGVFEGSKLTKKSTYKLSGPVLVLVDSREVAIGKDFAILIEVEEVSV